MAEPLRRVCVGRGLTRLVIRHDKDLLGGDVHEASLTKTTHHANDRLVGWTSVAASLDLLDRPTTQAPEVVDLMLGGVNQFAILTQMNLQHVHSMRTSE